MLEGILRPDVAALHSNDDSKLDLMVNILVDAWPQIESGPWIKHR